MSATNSSPFNYWHWFFKGSGGKPGYKRLINRWFPLHLLIGIIISWLVEMNLKEAANTVLLPLVGILIGLSFAWAGNAQALLQSEEIAELSEQREGGFSEYVYSYQTAILAILTTLVIWGVAGLGIFDSRWPTPDISIAYYIVKVFCFTLISMTLRECWQVVLVVQWLLLAQKEIRKHNNTKHDTRNK